MPTRFWLWTFVAFAVFGVVYWRLAQDELAARKAGVRAKQRAIAVELAPRLLPFRDKVERWAVDLAGEWPGDKVFEPGALESVRTSNGVYLRLLRGDATTAAALQKAAAVSLLDGFTSCFFAIKGAPSPLEGPPCRTQAQCEPGRLCNEYSVCALPPRPFNLRLAYKSLRILSDAWSDELQQSYNEHLVSAFDMDLDRVSREEVPLALEVLVRAQYFTLVLDEEPPGGVPPPPDGGSDESALQRVQRLEHHARVGIWRLVDGAPIARLRVEAAGRLLHTGRAREVGADTDGAVQRQVNSCAIAQAVRAAFPTEEPPDAAPAPAASGSGSAAPAASTAAPAAPSASSPRP